MNKVILIGNLTRNPEVNETPNGIPVCKLSLAVNRKSGNDTDFFTVVTWRAVAENCGRYLFKGRGTITF